MTQARLINRECARLLFDSHHLRSHINLQWQYQLLGNGLFCSRLSHALFDAELDTAERRAGVALSGEMMGLRLDGRETWPPASSELRLVLMGILADSYLQGGVNREELISSISFAVRDLSPEEVEQCVDPNSLQALDFLRLSYKPPAALQQIMTPVILAKYDTIFRLLLQILRMLHLVNRLYRDISPRLGSVSSSAAMRFRVEAHHFVTRLAAYFFETGIGAPWRRFENWLRDVEDELHQTVDPRRRELRADHGPDRLREVQERTLDEIMSGLMLRKRQLPVRKLLQDIFDVILLFAKNLDRGKATAAGDGSQDVTTSYAMFRKKMDVFITVCRALTEKGFAAGNGRDGGPRGGDRSGEVIIERLLLSLDMNGYYAGKPLA
jgi:hypothetical protein